ncbi:MAG: hypothetical protein JWN26_712 [Candidatus Saccharibacteria bacterium]|nr:hypothetical protein [Candidatus Saccharibacteria bacterium]
MKKYVAFLRGIGPGNPNMRNDKLCAVFDEIGFNNVQSVIASGNIIFETDRTDILGIETEVEQTILLRLGFSTTVIVRSALQLQRLITANPFGNRIHGPTSYLLVTFTKKPTKLHFELPYQPPGKPYQLIQIVDDTLFTVTDNTIVKTPDLMTWLEKELSKGISSRTWNTILRIFKRF